MIILIQNLMNHQEIFGFVSIFTFSFILHIVIFFLFNLFYPNVNILKLVNNNYYFFLYSLFVFILFWYSKDTIYLEDVYIKTKIDNVEIKSLTFKNRVPSFQGGWPNIQYPFWNALFYYFLDFIFCIYITFF